jgi:hypothetical protein
MAGRIHIYISITVALFLVLSCGCSVSQRENNLKPAVVGHMDMSRKKDYILNNKETLKNFLVTAQDITTRQKPLVLQELSVEAKKYIEAYVDPIVADFEADKNLETRLEIAKLELLSGLLYAELSAYREARDSLSQMTKRYSKDSTFLNGSIDPNDIGYGSLDEGMQALKEKISRR